MSRNGRFGLLALAAVIAVVVFVLARPDEGSDKADDPSTDSAQTTPPLKDKDKHDGPTATAESAQPPPQTITVRGGEPAGGLKEIKVQAGERVRLEVRSSDTSDEIHVHGYALSKDMAPGKPVRFSFLADLEGVFEIELEGAGVEIASLSVEP